MVLDGLAEHPCCGHDRLCQKIFRDTRLGCFANSRTVLVDKRNEFTDALVKLIKCFELTLAETYFDRVERILKKFYLGSLALFCVLSRELTYEGAEFLEELCFEFLNVVADSLRFEMLDSNLFARFYRGLERRLRAW